MMFDPKRKRIAPKSVGDALLRDGQIMRLTADTETTGFVRSDTPYSTPAFPAITEWGDCLTDFAGNYLNSAQIFPRRPEGILAQPGAVLLQRFSKGPAQIEDKDLPPYWTAMAQIAWRIEQATNAYDQMATADEREFIHGIDFNKQLTSTEDGRTPGQIDFSEEVIPIPLLDDQTGEVVYDYRWHPLRKKLSYRLGKDDFEDNIFYQEDDGSRWKWVDPVIGIRFFNAPYDIPIVRANLQRVGFDSNDATFMYSRGTVTNKERKKNFLLDTRNLVYATAIYGPQGEDGLKLGELVDPATGEIRRSEAQTAIMEKAMSHMNGIRMFNGGPMNVNDGSFADLVMAHGAHIDAVMTASLENYCMDLAPWLYANHAKQSDEARLTKQILTRQPSDDGKKMPVVSLPKKAEGKFHSESMYRFLDTDDQMGRFKRLVFLHTDGNFHKGKNEEGKAFKDMSKDEWVDYLSMKKVRNNPDSPVRVISMRKYPQHVDYTDVFQRTSLGKKYRGQLAEIEKDLIYINENPQMQENIRAAQADIQRKMRYGSHYPQVTMMEDEFPHLFAGEVPYLDDPDSVRYQDGARTPHPIVKTIKGRMDNDYKFMKENDRALNQFAVKAHLIDVYKDYFAGDSLGLYDGILGSSTQIDKFRHVDIDNEDAPNREKAIDHLKRFKKSVEKAYAQRTEAAGDEKTLFDDMINPKTGAPFFDEKGKVQIESMADAAHLRGVMRMQVNMARQALDNFQDMAQNVYDKKFDTKEFPYKDIIDEIARPKAKGDDSAPSLYFDRAEGSRSKKKKIAFTSPRDAVDFRSQIGRRMMDDFLAELSKEKSITASGKVDKNWCKSKKANEKRRLLFASPDNGDNGSTPYIIDSAGRALDIEFLKQQDERYVLANLKSEDWSIRFHRLGSEMDTLRILKRFVDLEMAEDIPEPLYHLMYFSNLMHELWGMPNETADVARASNLETFEFELERLELAASTKNPKLLEKSDNPLLADAAKAVQFEEGQRILGACRTWLNDMKKKYPKPTFDSAPELIEAGRHDSETGLPFDYISHKITRDPTKSFLDDKNFVVVDVPAYHLRTPIHTTEKSLPAQGIVVPKMDAKQKAAVNKGKRVIFREIETGRIYAAGPNSVHDIAAKDKSRYSTIIEKVESDYERAGTPIAEKDTVSFIGIEKLYPLANTRHIEQNVQSFKLPSLQFDGLTFPKMSAFGENPIRTVILPTDYCPQLLEPGKLLRLRETTAEVFSNMQGIVGQETGHIYDTTLTSVDGIDGSGKVVGITIEELCETFRQNQNDRNARILEGSGFAGVDHLYSKLNQWRADGLKTRDQKLLVAHFEAVNDNYFQNGRDEALNMWGYFNALTAPKAAFAVNGQHPSPSVYRDHSWTEEMGPS